MSFEYYIYYFLYTFWVNPPIIKFALIAICVFTFFALFGLSAMDTLRAKAKKKSKIKRKLEDKYGEQITEILTSKQNYTLGDVADKIDCDVKDLKELDLRTITNMMLRVGDTAEYVNTNNHMQLIAFFKLQSFWEKKLIRGSVMSRRRALQKLDDLRLEIQGSTISILTYSRTSVLRKSARAYYLFYSKINPFVFFDEDFDPTFNAWDRIEVHRMLKRRVDAGDKLPNFSQWLHNSQNLEFQHFLIQEITFFGQRECIPQLMELLHSPNIMLRKYCIEALGEMGHKEAEELIKHDYLLLPQVVQHSVVKAVEKLNTGCSLSFLEDAYHNAHDNESQLVVIHAIYNYGEIGKALFHKMREEAEGFTRQMFEHVTNPLIA